MPAVVALPMLALWYLPEAWLAWRCGWSLRLLSPLAWLLRDCLMPAIYVAAWASDEFVWNGHRMTGTKPTTEAF
jgi:ceramide glucosyltransferase